MAILHVMADLSLDEAISSLLKRESPLSYKYPEEDSFIFREPKTETSYIVSSLKLEPYAGKVCEQVARELQFRHRVDIRTVNFNPPFPQKITTSTKRVVDYFLDNGVACYLLLQTLTRAGNIVIGGYNPRTDKLIETRGDYIHR